MENERFMQLSQYDQKIPLEINYFSKPDLNQPSMIAAWPGMGYLAKISADYLRRRVKAVLFAEVTYYHNVLLYKKGLASLAPIKHKLYAAPSDNLIICVGDAQPSIPEESLRLAEKIVDIAKSLGVIRIYTMAAFPSEYLGEPHVYGIFTDEHLRTVIEEAGVEILDEEGAVNGLNGVIIGLAKMSGLEGVCLMGDIKYANVPQHISSKVVLEKLAFLLGIEIDTSQLSKRAQRIDTSIRKRLDIHEEEVGSLKDKDPKLGYIS